MTSTIIVDRVANSSGGEISVSEVISIKSTLDARSPSIIRQDSSNRFVTDEEKAAWNSKQPAGTYATGTGTATGINTGDQDLSGKQDTLVSGTNIRKVNGHSLLGSTDLDIDVGVTSVNGAAGAVTGIADLTTAQTLTNKTLTTPSVNGYTEGVATANTGTAYTIDIATASVQILTLTGNCTYTFPTATAGKSFLLVQKQDATGSRTTTWPSTVKWPSSTAPTLTATAGKAELFGFTCDGTYWYGRSMGGAYL